MNKHSGKILTIKLYTSGSKQLQQEKKHTNIFYITGIKKKKKFGHYFWTTRYTTTGPCPPLIFKVKLCNMAVSYNGT